MTDDEEYAAPLRVLDLYSGMPKDGEYHGWMKAYIDAGHNVIHTSPPCDGYSNEHDLGVVTHAMDLLSELSEEEE